MKAYERLLKYVTFRTPSDENSENTPSSACQFELARFLKNEMEGLNLSDIVLDDMCYLYGKLPATKGYENAPAIGFIAHMDTVSDYCNHDITPVITENFNGVSLTLPAGITLSDSVIVPSPISINILKSSSSALTFSSIEPSSSSLSM